jgi:hypothetical protein
MWFKNVLNETNLNSLFSRMFFLLIEQASDGAGHGSVAVFDGGGVGEERDGGLGGRELLGEGGHGGELP